ncbi:MAG TPA: hypothetical protein VHC22_20670 [Pirellulales bacterium]|nr:hypothetical protein [Pirellulales bacterium]
MVSGTNSWWCSSAWCRRGAMAVAAICLLASGSARGESPAEGSQRRRWYDPRRYVERLMKEADEVRHLEIVESLTVMAHGKMPGEGTGWFHGGQGRYDWQWLADHYDANDDDEIDSDEFPPAAADLLAGLDRDQNGKIEAKDMDWSSDAEYVKQMSQTRRLFGSIDRDRNGQVTKEEWRTFFERTALDADSITPDDLQAALFPPAPPSTGKEPTPLDFLRGFASGELGSIMQGPSVGRRAPDFELADHEHKGRIRLSQFFGKQPVVLIFGSFT